MRKLWSASNIKVYGGGVAEAEFLNELAQLVGEYRYSNMTRSRSKQGTSYSHDSRIAGDGALDERSAG